MIPADRARQIMDQFFVHGVRLNKQALEEEIRWALAQAAIDAQHPPELWPNASAIVVQIMYFVNDWSIRLHHADYADQANALQKCKRIVTDLARKPAQAEMARAERKTA